MPSLKTLFLLRHASSKHSTDRDNDFERGLTDGGGRAARAIGGWMRDHDRIPALAVHSTARRAAETWKLVSSELGAEIAGIAEEKLYLCAPEHVFEIIIPIPDSHQSVLIVGHNPGLHQLALVLVGDGSPDDIARLEKGYPPCALTEIWFEIDSWSELRPESGRLERLVFPRDLDDGG